MTNTATTYRRVDAPRYASMSSFDCSDCGHPELGHPVFLDSGNGARAYGTGCAARLLGVHRTALDLEIAMADLATAGYGADSAFHFFMVCKPGRVTAKFRAEAVSRVSLGTPEERSAKVAAAEAAYRATMAARKAV